MKASLPPAVQTLLEQHVDALEKLEILDLLAKQRANGVGLTISEVSGSLGFDPRETASCIEALRESKLVIETGGGSLQLVDDPALQELLRIYADDPITTVSAIASVAMRRIRGMAARTFADAFDMRRRKKPDG